jgi:glycosyltransferase involved in cell wall biosynthesis
MKILIIPEYGEFGGTLTFFLKLLKFYKDNEFEIGVLIQKNQAAPEILSLLENSGVTLYIVSNRKQLFFKSYFSILYDLFVCTGVYKKFRPDIVHVSNGTPYLMLGAFIFRTPIIFTLHTYPGKSLALGMRLYLRLFLNKRKKLTTVSKYSANIIAQRMSVSESEIEVIYNSFSRSAFHENSCLDQNIEEITILTVGHLTWYKNPEVWLSVAHNVVTRHSNVKFIWLGDGDYIEEMKSNIKKINLQEKILVPGFSKNVDYFYSKASIYFQPSLIESHGIAVVEAMSHSLPCITSSVGGLPESVIDGDTGFVCNPNDIDEFTDRLLYLINSIDLRKKMGLAGRRRAELLFSESVQESKMLFLCRKITE